MDPAKRICLKNLPENCTKREIAEMVRSRTGAQPHSIDLGVDAEGNTRRYAHFSCEGAKNVLEALSAGCSLRGCSIGAHSAKIHFSFRYAQERQKREREEEMEKEAQDAFWTSVRQRLETKGHVGELSQTPRRLRSFYFERQKYAAVASEIAAKCREAYRARNPSSSVPFRRTATKEIIASEPVSRLEAEVSQSAANAMTKAHSNAFRKQKKGQPGEKHGQKEKVAADIPPPPPEPTKAEKKLSGLQAKLQQLKQKMARSC